MIKYKLVDEEEFLLHKEEFANLYEICFNAKMSINEVIWRYIHNPYSEILACFAYDGDKLIANYSVSPIRLMVEGTEKKAVLSLNTMTHPQYVGKGLFVDLASQVYKFAESKGYIGVIGFPNNISNRTFLNKLNWKDIEAIPMVQLDLDNISHPTIDPSIFYDDEFKLNYESCHKNSNIYVKKSQAYLKWRYLENPTTKYHNVVLAENNIVSSYMVFKEYKNIINVVDFACNTAMGFKNLLDSIILISKRKQKKAITLWSKLGSPEHLYCEKLGCKLATPVTYFGGSLFNEKAIINPEQYYQAMSWSLSLCDDNVF